MEAVTPGPAWRRYARLAAADPRVASYLAARRSPALARHLQLPFVRQFALTEGKPGILRGAPDTEQGSSNSDTLRSANALQT